MNIIRRYKIHLLYKEILTEKEFNDLNIIFKSVNYSKENFELIEFIYYNILNLKQVRLKGFHNFLFYFKDDECIFEQDLNCTWFGVNNYLIWSVFETKFNYNYQEIGEFIKDIVGKAYKLNEVTPDFETINDLYRVEEAYKQQLNEYNTKI